MERPVIPAAGSEPQAQTPAATPETPANVPASPAAPVDAAPAASAPEPAAVVAPPAAPAQDAAKPEQAKPEIKADDKPKLSTEEPSLLETFDKDKKVAETKDGKPVEAKSDAKPEDKPAELPPVEYKYTVPETLKVDDATKAELHTALDAFRANPAEGVQGLVDLHNKKMQDFANFTLQEQHRVFNETRAGWRKDWMADAEIGGSGYQTSMAAIARMRDLLVPEKERAAFDQFLRITGAGDHPMFGRLLHNAARYFDEPQASSIPTDIKPSKTNGRAPKGSLYTHPSSQNMES